MRCRAHELRTAPSVQNTAGAVTKISRQAASQLDLSATARAASPPAVSPTPVGRGTRVRRVRQIAEPAVGTEAASAWVEGERIRTLTADAGAAMADPRQRRIWFGSGFRNRHGLAGFRTDTSMPESASRVNCAETVSSKAAWTANGVDRGRRHPLAGLGPAKVFLLGVQGAKGEAAI